MVADIKMMLGRKRLSKGDNVWAGDRKNALRNVASQIVVPCRALKLRLGRHDGMLQDKKKPKTCFAICYRIPTDVSSQRVVLYIHTYTPWCTCCPSPPSWYVNKCPCLQPQGRELNRKPSQALESPQTLSGKHCYGVNNRLGGKLVRPGANSSDDPAAIRQWLHGHVLRLPLKSVEGY
jgi:hypothetical protein